MVEHSFGCVEFPYLLSLASGGKSNLTSNNMADFRLRGITVDGNNDTDPDNIPDQVPQPVNSFNWES